MDGTVTRSLGLLANNRDGKALRTVLRAVADRLSSVALSSAGLVIKAGASALAKTGAAAFHAVANGKLITIAAGTDMPALTGLNITANRFNVACFFVNDAGTVSVKFGTEAETRAAVKFPVFPEKQALIGFLIITHSSAFTGGTTALDTATTQYISPLGAVDPTILLD